MAASTRRQKIEAMLEEDPTDVFLRYGLALELIREGASDSGLALLSALAKESPPYVPAFFMAAQHLAERDRVAEARAYLRTGIEQARAQNDTHAAAEMSEFLASLGSRGPDD